MLAFSWKLLLGRLPTRDALARRGVPLNGACGSLHPLCSEVEECIHHLFLNCSFSYAEWVKVYEWVRVSLVLPSIAGRSLRATRFVGPLVRRGRKACGCVVIVALEE